MATDTVHHIVKDAFHEMVAGIQKQPYYPSIKKPKSSMTASQKRARKLAEQAAGQSYGTGSMSYSASAGKKKKRIEREVASQKPATPKARASVSISTQSPASTVVGPAVASAKIEAGALDTSPVSSTAYSKAAANC